MSKIIDMILNIILAILIIIVIINAIIEISIKAKISNPSDCITINGQYYCRVRDNKKVEKGAKI